ncbi:hypothetical protein HPB47_019701 [Ixodes persulcatus]|uniref:Uncharacterized protein n=1 Tax=Ixodes persulcatus TaxID=34615 RepID=A0AC60QHJ0_IXOPE|nr:hypothetical protein HPB47_019701 [Ixodes persulcatus]
MLPLPLETNDAVLRGPVLERWSPSRTSSASQSLPLPGVSASGPRLPCLASPRSRPGVRRDDRERLGARAATSKMAPKLVGNPHCRRIISGAALSSLARTIKDASPPSCRPVLWITARHSSEPQQSAPNWNNKARLGAVLMTPRTSLYPREACVHPANNTTDFGASNDSFFSGRKAREQQRGRAAGPLSPNNPPRVSGNPSVKEGGGLRRKSRDRSMHQSSRRRGSGPRLIHEAVRPAGCGRRAGQRRGQGGRSTRTWAQCRQMCNRHDDSESLESDQLEGLRHLMPTRARHGKPRALFCAQSSMLRIQHQRQFGMYLNGRGSSSLGPVPREEESCPRRLARRAKRDDKSQQQERKQPQGLAGERERGRFFLRTTRAVALVFGALDYRRPSTEQRATHDCHFGPGRLDDAHPRRFAPGAVGTAREWPRDRCGGPAVRRPSAAESEWLAGHSKQATRPQCASGGSSARLHSQAHEGPMIYVASISPDASDR